MTQVEILKKYFGYDSFRPAQEEIINSIIQGENVVAILPTGAGKSICYQVPALLSPGFSIVVSPLIALMKDQVDSLNKLTDVAAFINSSMTFNEANEVFRNISYGKYKLLYLAPEKLENLSFAERIKNLNPNYVFVDEAHCISEWGHNFRPSYSKIKDFLQFTGIKKVSAFTATATKEVIDDISKNLGITNPKLIVNGFQRDNLNINVLVTKRKNEKTLELLRTNKKPAIIYTASRNKAEEVSLFLRSNGIVCSYYHAGLSSIERKRIQEEFLNDVIPVIAATNAFGMGIDKKDIRTIVHYNMPGSIENYYQEIGRGGRDGLKSNIFLLYDEKDVFTQNYFLNTSHPDKSLVLDLYAAICDYGNVGLNSLPQNEIAIDIEYLSNHTKKQLSKGLMHSAFKILEHAGYVKQLSEYDKKTTIEILKDKDSLKSFISNNKNKRMNDALLYLLREYGGVIFSSKINISLKKIAMALSITEMELNEAFINLDNLGMLKFYSSPAKESIVLLVPRVKKNDLIIDLSRLNKNYLNMQKKIEAMVNFVYSEECRFKFIINYFGEDNSTFKCGNCDNCLDPSKDLSESTYLFVKEKLLHTLFLAAEPITEISLMNIVRGTNKNQKYDELETFKSLNNYERNEIKFVINDLINFKLIEKHGIRTIKYIITDKGLTFLENSGLLVKTDVKLKDNEHLELYSLLRNERENIAKRFQQSVSVICSDDILKEISVKKPVNQDELLKINGFSIRAFNKIGNEFLDIIRNYKNTSLPDNKFNINNDLKETLELVEKGYSLQEISKTRKVTDAIISMQIESILSYYPFIDINKLLENQIICVIIQEIKKGTKDLKELKSRLPNNIRYADIRIVLAKFKYSPASF